MPVIIGPAEIITVNGGIVKFGDSAFLTPKVAAQVMGGSGGFNTGGVVFTNNGISGTNIADIDLVDQPIVGNN